MTSRLVPCLFAIALLPLAAASARPEGALAVGMHPSGAQDGFTFGYSVNWPTTDEADARALRHCRTNKGGGDRAVKARCRVVERFTEGCVAVAMDPGNGTPGVGWAIAADRIAAERGAITECHRTAGEGRRLFCRVEASECEGQ